MGILYDNYVKLMVWLGAEAPDGYEHLTGKVMTLQRTTSTKPTQPVQKKPAQASPQPATTAQPKPSAVSPAITPAPTPVVPPVEPSPSAIETAIVAEQPLQNQAQFEAPTVPLFELETPSTTRPIIDSPADLFQAPDEADTLVDQPTIVTSVIPVIDEPPIFLEPEPTPPFVVAEPPETVQAVYVSYATLKQDDVTTKLLDLLDQTDLNAFVLDLKADNGLISYPTQLPLAQDAGASQGAVPHFINLIEELRGRNIYLIGRLVTFKDHQLANSFPDYAIRVQDGQTLWQDKHRLNWTDPFNSDVWAYNIDLAVEAAQLGFNEILFDDLRFPLKSQAGMPNFGQPITPQTRTLTITSFLSSARGQLEPFGTVVSVNTMGYTCWRTDDSQVGQNLEQLADYAHVIAPMLYPSDLYSGIPGYKNPVQNPYDVVYQSALQAMKRLANRPTTLRPWIQDFADYRFDQRQFGPAELEAQINGALDAGSAGYMAWSPTFDYTVEAYR